MAVSRYDQRKTYEEAEANAIGTEYLRADLLPAANAALERELLKKYLDQRVLFYVTRDDRQLRQIDTGTSEPQTELWSHAAAAQPTPLVALAVSGMNDVLNSQGYRLVESHPSCGMALMFAIDHQLHSARGLQCAPEGQDAVSGFAAGCVDLVLSHRRD